MKLSQMTVLERLKFILNNPEDASKINEKQRNNALLSALEAGVKLLEPLSRERRAIDYILRTPGCCFCFGGSDAVGPAIQMMVDKLETR